MLCMFTTTAEWFVIVVYFFCDELKILLSLASLIPRMVCLLTNVQIGKENQKL